MSLLRTYGDGGVCVWSISHLSIGAQAWAENVGKKIVQTPHETCKRDRQALGIRSDSGPGAAAAARTDGPFRDRRRRHAVLPQPLPGCLYDWQGGALRAAGISRSALRPPDSPLDREPRAVDPVRSDRRPGAGLGQCAALLVDETETCAKA